MTGTDTLASEAAAQPLPIAGLGAVDCDVHPRSPRRADLMPYLDSYWSEMFMSRSIDRLELTSYPESTAPYRHPGGQEVNADAASLARHHLDPLGLEAAILNVVSGIHAVYDPYLSTALCAAANRWLAEEWLARDRRLRASLLVPLLHPEAAVEEIERYAGDHRFVQVLTLAMGEMPLGRRAFWPIHEAAARHGFALGIHAGGTYRHAPTQSGFPSFLVEDHIHQAQGFANQVGSLVAEGVFANLPDLKVVLIESGVTWMPGLMWRMSKDWRGARIEVPWVKEMPSALIRRHVRMTTQPFDGPSEVAEADKAIAHLRGVEMLLFSTDFPHDHGRDISRWPENLPQELAGRLARDNVRETYPRLEFGS
jgi:uncharacterized protein